VSGFGLGKWLGRLSPRRRGEPAAPVSPEEVPVLLRKAAECYLSARYFEDASRLFEILGDYRQAAHCYEQRGLWAQAGDAWEQASDWRQAAACYQRANRFEEAARALEQAGERLDAAWLWALEVRRIDHALRLLAMLDQEESHTPAERAVVRALCESSGGDKGLASRRLRRLLDDFPSFGFSFAENQLLVRCGAVARRLGRPDLEQMAFSVAVARNLPDAEAGWESWSRERFGEGGLHSAPASCVEKTSDEAKESVSVL